MHFEILGRKTFVPSDNIAIISGNRTLTYNQLNREVQKTANVLYSLGVKKSTHIAILSDNNIDFVILIFALWKIQAVPVPMNIRLLDKEIEKLIDHSEADFVFIHSELKNRIPDCKKQTKTFPLETPESFVYLEELKSLNSDQTALILYTSGTTGSPKGVILTYSNLLNSADSADSLINHTHTDKWLSSLPYYHIGGISIPVRAFLYGAQLIIPDSIKAADIAEALWKFKPTLASFVTTTLKQLLDSGSKPNKELRLILLGGGPVEDELAIRAFNEDWKLVKVYGSTETSSLISAILLNENPLKLSSAGKPLPPNQIFIVDENGKILPEGQTGEIVISGKSVMKGYWKNQEQTDLKLNNNKYFSGDLGYFDKEGYLHIESRRTDLIISGGENINPLEVENAISKFQGIKEVCVFPLSDKKWGQTVAAVIVPSSGQISLDELKVFLKDKISAFKIPKMIFFTNEIPRTSLGKIQREIIRRTYEGHNF